MDAPEHFLVLIKLCAAVKVCGVVVKSWERQSMGNV